MRAANRLVLGTSIADHIGGRWAISWIAYVINAPINMFGMLSNIVDARQAPLGTWFLIWLVGYTALGIVLLLANATAFRNRRTSPVPVWWVIALGFVAGGTRGGVVGVLADSWGLSGGGSALVATRILTGALLGAILIPAAAFLLSVVASYSTKRRELLAEIVVLERQRMQAEGESQRLRDVLTSDAQVDVLQVVSQGDLRSVREISHRMWQESHASTRNEQPGIAWRSVLRDTFVNYPYPGAAVAAVWAVSALGSVITAVGLVRGLIQVLCSVMAIWVSFAVARKVRVRTDFGRVALLVLVLIVVDVVTGPLASALFDPRPLQSGSGQVIANTVWLPTLAAIMGVMVSAIRSSEIVVDRLLTQVRAEEISAIAAAQERATIQRELAEALHDTQSRIYAARSAGTDLDLHNLLVTRDTGDAREQYKRLLDTWGLLMNVQVGASLDDLDDHQIDTVNRILSEALANAYRHGGATFVDISVTREAAGIRVLVIDDGRGPKGDGQPGLGSAVLESIAPGAWSLSRLEGQRTVLSALLRDSQT